MSTKVALIYTLFGSGEEARRVAGILIEEKLAACANHLAPAVSQYRWEGALREEQEFPVLLKTAENKVALAIERLKQLHDYDTPAILSWVTDQTDSDYEKWVKTQLQ